MKHSVLLVDDDANLLEALQRQLYKEPYRILTAQSGGEAMEILEGISVDVVVSDQEMPGMKGTQFLWKVRKAYPDVILFMLTGQATPRMATLAVNEIGIAGFLVKPCNAVDLAIAINQALQYRELYKHARRLLRKVVVQDALLERIEHLSPGLIEGCMKDMERGSVELPTGHQSLVESLSRVLGEDTDGAASHGPASPAPCSCGSALLAKEKEDPRE